MALIASARSLGTENPTARKRGFRANDPLRLMKNTLLSIFCVLFVLVNGESVACSCVKVEISEVLEQSENIVVARVTDTVQSPASGDASGRYIIERASFVVIETIKGDKRIGDTIEARSEIGPGQCGISARNTRCGLSKRKRSLCRRFRQSRFLSQTHGLSSGVAKSRMSYLSVLGHRL